jgi:hypothetical protein
MKTHLIKPIFRFTLALATAVSLLAPSAWADDPTYLMPPNTPFDRDGSITRMFLKAYVQFSPGQQGFLPGRDVDPDGHTVPLKTLRITNNTEHTVYPAMRDPNNPPYDPYDDIHKEYRGYIGYKNEKDGNHYLGLKSGESILVRIPLVFWNGGRIIIGTDGKYLTRKTDNETGEAEKPNPLAYQTNSRRSITNAETSDDTIKNGVVMWYRAETPVDFVPDSEDQLAEFTVRDHDYLINVRNNRQIPDNQMVTLINFNVSNVDNLYLPLAMEANDVWVVPMQGARNGWVAGKNPEDYGWTGAINTVKFVQDEIGKFTKEENNEYLGQYFGGKGWPYYNIGVRDEPNAPRKIPSGANIFPQSPLKDVRNHYFNGEWQTHRYMLSSGGTGPIKVSIGAAATVDSKGQDTLHVSTAEKDKLKFLEEGDVVTAGCAAGPIPANTTIRKIIDRDHGILQLNNDLKASSEGCVFDFFRPVKDYAAEAMIKLWYSWAQFYLAHWKGLMEERRIAGSIDKNTATLTFNEAHPELVEGTAVKGPGLDDALTEPGTTKMDMHQGLAVILQIASDKKSVILSQVVNKDSKPATFTFLPPKENPLLHSPAKENLYRFDFSDEPDCGEKSPNRNTAACRHDPYEFSQKVYLIMASMNQIGKPNNDNVSKFMQDIVGANMGFIFANSARGPASDMVTSIIRDMIKSVLRGVSDFTKHPDLLGEKGNHTSWYPDPKKPHGGQPFNVFNLDPFVWFVHVPLGFTGYGFSVDDDVANIGAGGSSQLQITVAGTCGLKNTNEWTQQAPWGPVKGNSLQYSGPASSTNGDTIRYNIKSYSNTTPVTITTDGNPNLSNLEDVRVEVNRNGTREWVTFKAVNVTSKTFDLYTIPEPNKPSKPVAPGDYVFETNYTWSYPLHPYVDTGELTKVFHRVKGDEPDGTFLGTFVSVNGVDRNNAGEKFRVWALGRQKDQNNKEIGRLLLAADLTNANGKRLDADKYNFTFFERPETNIPPNSATPTPTCVPPDRH